MGCAGIGRAEITYEAATDMIVARFFPADWPCTPERLGAFDRLCGLNKVSYDPTNHTWTILANLEIGANDGSDTYFQIGSPERPRETLLVHGNVRVHPYWIKDINPGVWFTARRSVNRLTLGCANDTNVVATLKIASAPDAKRTLAVGTHKSAESFGGQLHVYGGTITAAIQDKAHRLGSADTPAVGMVLHGDEVIFRNATVSWVEGHMCSSAQDFKATSTLHVKFECENTVFAHGGTALSGNGDIRGCTFRDLDCAIWDQGGINLVLVDCAFRNNRRNWNLLYSAKGIVAVDCAIEPGENPDQYTSWLNPATKKNQYPCFESQRHIIVEVVETNRAPIPKAWVDVRAVPDEPGCVENGRLQTDARGSTPGRGQKQAIRLRETVIQATDTNQPAIRTYTYEIKASAAGYQPAVLRAVKPTNSWQVFTLTLPRAAGLSR